MSETAKCRERLQGYCTGIGIDLGFGGDPITSQALCFDLPSPYANVGMHRQHFAGDARDLSVFMPDAFDFVFSSHLLEDFEDTEMVLREWVRVLKPGGNLIIYCPDEIIYRAHCARTGQTYNEAHKIADFGLAHVRRALSNIKEVYVVYAADHVDEYSFEVVARKR